MIEIYNKHLPAKGYVAMTVLWWLFIREEYRAEMTEQVRREEWIHSQQQIEILVASVFVAAVILILTGISALWLFALPIIPLAVYLLAWAAEIALPPYSSAYADICFEREAKAHCADPEYYYTRKPFAWLKHILHDRRR